MFSLRSHPPVSGQVADGSVADVTAINGAGEPHGSRALIGRVQRRLQGRPHGSDRQDAAPAGNQEAVPEGGAGVEQLHPQLLQLRQAWDAHTHTHTHSRMGGWQASILATVLIYLLRAQAFIQIDVQTAHLKWAGARGTQTHDTVSTLRSIAGWGPDFFAAEKDTLIG